MSLVERLRDLSSELEGSHDSHEEIDHASALVGEAADELSALSSQLAAERARLAEAVALLKRFVALAPGGEIADMMLDGTLCTGCGELLGEATGYPMYCRGCKKDQLTTVSPEKVACSECGRSVKPAGLADHKRDKHPPSSSGEQKG